MELNAAHPGSMGWTIRLTPLELTRIIDMARALNPGNDNGEHVSLGLVGPATRRWVIEGVFSTGWIETAGGAADPVEPVSVPRFVLRSASVMAEEMGEVFLYQQADTGTYVIYSGDECLYADPLGDEPEMPSVDIDLDRSRGEWVSATLPVESARLMGTSYFHSLGMIDIEDDVFPYITLSVGEHAGRIRWTSSWDRWDLPTVSGETSADTKGSGRIALWPMGLLRMLGHIPPRGEVTISWDDSTDPHVWLTGSDWGVRCLVGEEMAHRYVGHIVGALRGAQFDLDEYEGPLPNPLVFTRGTMSLSVSVLNVGDGDFFRLATCVATDVPHGRAVQAELNALNDKFLGAKVLMQGDNIFLAVDMMATKDEDAITSAVELVDAYRKRCEGFDAILPLFQDFDDVPPGTLND